MISLEKVRKAADSINNQIIKTPLIHSHFLTHTFKNRIYLKLENLQKTGSFKIRGATYKLQTCLKKFPGQGVVTASAGNHAQGVALAAKNASVPATIVMPQWVSITKQEATRRYGGQVIIEGHSIGESLEKARELSGKGMTFIHPFDDPDIVAGQGTVGLEIFEDLKDADMIVVPIGGGGLISGICCVARALRPRVKIIGVQAAACPSAYEACQKGKITLVDSKSTIADGISVRKVGQVNFKIIQKMVDDIVLVKEDQIVSAILMLLEQEKILAEGAGAVCLAAFLSGAVSAPKGSKVVLVVSGGNVDSPLLGRIVNQGLLKYGRIMRMCVSLEDTPGAIADLLYLLARLKVNVLHIYHERNIRNKPIYITCVELEVETRGPDHIEEIADEVKKAGYEMELK
jgi:threonine dehydratase